MPFVFIFNTELLMIVGVAESGEIIWLDNLVLLAWVFVVSLFAMFAFASFMQGFFADDCNWFERILLLVLAILMFRPGFLLTKGSEESWFKPAHWPCTSGCTFIRSVDAANDIN